MLDFKGFLKKNEDPNASAKEKMQKLAEIYKKWQESPEYKQRQLHRRINCIPRNTQTSQGKYIPKQRHK